MTLTKENVGKLKQSPKCPKCGGKTTYCPGSTNLIPIPKINWVCTECSYEF